MAITAVTASATTGGHTSGASFTVASPTGTQAGDVLICVVGERATSESVTSIASGGASFTNLAFQSSGSNSAVSVWYRVVQSGDGTTWTVTCAVAAEACLMAYRGVDGVVPLDAQGTANSGTASPGTFGAVTTLTSGAWYVGGAALNNASSVLSTLSSGSPTPTIRGNAGNGGATSTRQAAALIDVAPTGTGSTGTFVYTLTSSAGWATYPLALRAALVYPLGYSAAAEAGQDAVYRM